MSQKLITQIGSLPFEDVEAAVDYVMQYPVPWLPELPRLGDAMLEYIKNPGKMSCLELFKQRTAGREVVKVQCIGPATLLLSGYDADDAVGRCCEHIAALLDGLDAGEVILFLDEPALGQTGVDYKSLWAALFASFDVTPGVHVCGNMNWDEMFSSELAIISFDASQFDITRYPGYRSGKRIAWGVNEASDVKDYQEGDLLTLPCGMGPKVYEVADCAVWFEKLTSIAESLPQVGHTV